MTLPNVYLEASLEIAGLGDVTLGLLDGAGVALGPRVACAEVPARPGTYGASVAVPAGAQWQDFTSASHPEAYVRGELPSWACLLASSAPAAPTGPPGAFFGSALPGCEGVTPVFGAPNSTLPLAGGASFGAVVVLRFCVTPHAERDASGGIDFDWEVRCAGFVPEFRLQSRADEGESWTDLLAAPTTDAYASGIGERALSYQGDDRYRLVVQDAATHAFVTAGPPVDARYQLGRADWLRYREMLRRERLQIEKLTGLPGWLLRRRTSGQPCPNCVSPVTGEVLSTECDGCFGTGFVGGYHAPWPLWADWGDTPPTLGDSSRQPQGLSEAAKTTAVVAGFPRVQFEDVVVDRGTGRRFVVAENGVRAVTFRSAPVKQVVTLSLLPPSDRAYDVPVPGL